MEMRIHQDIASVVDTLASISAMVDEHRPNPQRRDIPPLGLQFTATTDVYLISAQATSSSLYDQLTARLSQLKAMLQIVSGQGFETFRLQNEETQGMHLWACRMAADECLDLVQAIEVLEKPPGTPQSH